MDIDKCKKQARVAIDGEEIEKVRVEVAYFDTLCYFDTPRAVPFNNNEMCENTATFERESIFNPVADII